MPTALEAYQNFLIKIDKNDTNANIHISKGEFVLLYNEQRLVWLEEKLSKKGGDIDIHDLEQLLKKDAPLNKVKDDTNSSHFEMPDNYFKFDSSYSIAKKGKCERPITNWLVKSRNVNVLLNDTNSSPSFEYEETICIISEGNLVIYKGDFTILETFLNYYKEPLAIDIEGYTKIDGTPSTTINPELDSKSVNEIINRCAMEVVRNYENQEGAQLSKDRITSEN